MSLLTDERVPEGTELKLAEYLNRMFRDAKLSDDQHDQFLVRTILPEKISVGKLYYFGGAIAGTDIIVEGYWAYINGAWVQVSNNPEALHNPSLGSPWSNVGGADLPMAYYQHAGRVWLEGHITGGASGSSPFTLPVGYRPLGTVEFSLYSTSGGGGSGGHAHCVITSAGVITITLSGSSADVSFDGVSFRL